MGMDVYGKSSSSDTGVYFRANIWSWQPIMMAMNDCAQDIIPERTMELMCNNDGAGLDTQEECDKLANRLDYWLQNIPMEDGFYSPEELNSKDFQIDNSGCFVKESEVDKQETHSPYRVEKKHMKEFITFLRSCGGFEVC